MGQYRPCKRATQEQIPESTTRIPYWNTGRTRVIQALLRRDDTAVGNALIMAAFESRIIDAETAERLLLLCETGALRISELATLVVKARARRSLSPAIAAIILDRINPMEIAHAAHA